MTTEKTEALAHITEVYNARKAAIEARKPSVGNCVLMFEDCTRFVCGSTNDPTISGFEHALMFGDRTAARAFLQRTNLRDGKQEAPSVHLAFNAKQSALLKLEETLGTLIKDQASA